MAVILFYDTTELDKQQLTHGLKETDHYWEFVDGEIAFHNINPQAEIISVFVSSTVTREMMEQMPRLTLICCRSTGYNNIDLQAAKDRGVTVVNVPAYGDATVAEYAFTLLLALTRNLPRVLTTETKPFTLPELTGQDLFGKTMGVVGTGRIGQKTLKIANGFSMRTLAYDAYPQDELQRELHFEYTDLDRLLRESDFVSLHVPYNTATHHLLNRERLFSMKTGALLINTARGPLIDTAALVEALASGQLGGAGLDVIEGEKLLEYEEELALVKSGEMPTDTMRHSVEISALQKMPNVIVSPHTAFNTVEAIGRINAVTTQNIIGFYNHDIPNCIECKVVPSGKLILIRHTESEWNACGVWTGIADIGLSEKGKDDRIHIGKKLKELGIKINVAFYTNLCRTEETLRGICEVLQDDDIQLVCDNGMMERDYGHYTGQDKWKIKEELGDEQWQKIRRGWDEPVPNGETLKDVYERIVPEYENKVLPLLREGKNVLLVGHGNSFRALMKYLESISDEAIQNVEMLINQIVIYDIDPQTGLCHTGKTVIVETPTGASGLA